MNRRIYERDGCAKVQDIYLNDQFFYNRTPYDIDGDGYVGYKGNASMYYINLPYLEGGTVGLNLPYKEINDGIYGTHYEPMSRDTIFSEYFNVGSTNNLEFKCVGFDTASVRLYIQKQGSTTFTQVSLPLGEAADSSAVLIKLNLINGYGNNYRLVYVNLDTITSHYIEHLNIGLLPIRDTVSSLIDLNGRQGEKLNVENSQVIEKMKLLVVPNPARELVNITAFLPFSIQSGKNNDGQIVLCLYTSLGIEIFRKEVNSGQTLTLPINKYTSGAYFIKADCRNQTVKQIIEPFIIQR